MSKQPSPFYDLFDGAYEAILTFPVDEEGCGPYFDADGNLDLSKGAELSHEPVQVVDLGGGCYRVGDNSLIMCGLTLFWGDEFIANKKGDDLELVKRLPSKFKHYGSIGKAESLGKGFAADRHQHDVGIDGFRLAAGGGLENHLAAIDAGYLAPELEGETLTFQKLLERLRHLGVGVDVHARGVEPLAQPCGQGPAVLHEPALHRAALAVGSPRRRGRGGATGGEQQSGSDLSL